ncbi:duplicated homeodomain-like superfamily protein [Actinidia rufa]|uniref:Duplicated homeodomain-like superfamily protein n=1 Tax=Actinidia rufa TaxID=165716 RepID=A0A7J0EDQ3_9ERIC|nr:duplicated homeodomain-like superfamily protein [Actinidia rufa]
MPPEPLPWDRRDFFKERKRERSTESVGFVSRWRENPHHGREFVRSRPPGHAKQGGRHNFSQEPGHEFTPSRSNEKIFGDENCRPSESLADGKFSRNSRENRGSFSQKDWRGHSWENGSSPNGPGRSTSVSDQRSVDDMIPYDSHPHSDFVNNWDQIHSEGQNNQTGRVNGLGAGQILERENLMGSIDRRPLKWTRSGSLTSRGSGFSHSSSSKSMGVDSGDAKAKLEPRNGTPVQCPSGDAVACATSAALSEETNSRKKPRLGWGEGLAKYEKKKVEGPDDSATKNGMVVCVNTEPLHSNGSILSDKSPRFTAFSDCASPGTPSSVACSTSPGMEDKPPVKRENIDNDTSKLSGSPRLLSQNHVKGIDFNLENSDLIPIANLCSSLGSSSLQRECQAKPCEELVVNSSGSLRPVPLQLVSSGDMIAKEAIGGLEEARGQLKDEDIDSPGTVSSKFVEPHRSVNAAAMSESVKHGGSNLDLDASKPSNQEVTCSVYGSNGEKEESLSDCDSGGRLMDSKSSAAPVGASLHSSREDKLYDLILTSNKDSARKASDMFNKLLPSDRCHVDILRASSDGNRAGFSGNLVGLASNSKVLGVNEHGKRGSEGKSKIRKGKAKVRCLSGADREGAGWESSFWNGNGGLEGDDVGVSLLGEGNHKSDWFVKIKKPELAGQGKLCSTNNYLVTSGKRWNREMNASSLDMLGAAIVANGDDSRQSHQKCKSRFLMGETTVYRAPRGDDGIVQRSGKLDSFCNESERETVAADVLAGICGSIPSEAMSSCIKSSFKLGESCKDWKCQKVGSSTRWPLTTVVAQNVVDGTCSDESCGEMDPTHWTDEEKSIFIQAVSSYGKDFTMISRCVRTRSRDECIVFFSKARKCLGLDMIRPRPGDEEVHANDNVNGSGGDNEDACVVETGSVICREISGSKIDEETMLSDLNKDHCESDPTETMNVLTDRNSLDENNGTGGIGCKDPERQSENMVADDRQSDGKLELHFDGDFKMDNGIDTMTVIVQGHKDAVFPPATETGGDEATVEGTSFGEPLSVKEADGQGLSGSGADGDIIAVGQKLGVQQPASENNLNEKQEENGYTSTSDHSDLYSVENLHANRKASKLAEDINTCMEFGGDHKQEPKISLELNPPPESDVISVEHNVPLVNANSLTKDPPASQHELILSPDKPCTLGLEKMSDNQCKKSARSDDHNLHQSGDTVLGHTNSSQILRGYPLRLSTKKEVNGDISSKKLGSFQSFSNGCFLQKCKNSQTQSLAAELPFLSPEHKTDHSQPPPEKSYRNGDLKLFGKILTYPTSQQNEDIGVIHENKDEGVQHPKLSSKTFNLKFKGTVSVDGNSIPPKLDHINYLGLESLPVRSYGYWDGTRTRTGFSSLPDSAILLAKYPAAFSNCSIMSDSEQKQSHSVVRSNERNLNGVSGFSSRERSISNGVADSQLYRNREGVSVQPLTVDMKQRQEMLFSEKQRRNGLEAVSNVPQAAKGVVGINMGGRGGILGGACTGVSDPVAAIKMHYAKAEQYGVQTASVIREDESWRGFVTCFECSMLVGKWDGSCVFCCIWSFYINNLSKFGKAKAMGIKHQQWKLEGPEMELWWWSVVDLQGGCRVGSHGCAVIAGSQTCAFSIQSGKFNKRQSLQYPILFLRPHPVFGDQMGDVQ